MEEENQTEHALNKSYDSMGSQEKEPLHYNIDSDNEPPTDEVGDKITIVKKMQVTKEILEVNIYKLTILAWRRPRKTRPSLQSEHHLCSLLCGQSGGHETRNSNFNYLGGPSNSLWTLEGY